jgi:hypothetical protein
MIKNLRVYATKIASYKPITNLLIDALENWFDSTPMEPAFYDDAFYSIINSQERAGWQQLLLGRFVTEWAEYLNHGQGDHRTGQQWVTGAVTIIWNHVLNNWDTRNKEKHGVDADTREKAQLAQAKQETEELYKRKNEVLPSDRDKFYSSLTEHFDKEPSSTGLRQWLATWQATLLASMDRSKQLGLRGSRSITEFFRK